MASRRRIPPGKGGGRVVGTFRGIPISLDSSWFLILVLVLATFSGGSFPALLPGRGTGLYILLGGTAALLFFLSLLLHEFAHALVAQRRGIEVAGVILFLFGGMVLTREDARSPAEEILIAAAGPLASLLAVLLFWGISLPTAAQGWDAATVLLRYLAFLNLALALFNLLPGFPLDGGRILRGVVWGFTGSRSAGTRGATFAGRTLGLSLIFLGILLLIRGSGILPGLWLAVIGWFILGAAGSTRRSLRIDEALQGLTAEEAMAPAPETVPPDLSLSSLVDDHFLRRPWSAFPVTEEGIVVGLVTLTQVKGIPREEWDSRQVADIMFPLEEITVVSPETPLVEVLERMGAGPSRRALVAREWELLGILSARDLGAWMERASLRPRR